MKILLVIPTLGFGGAERLVVTLAKKLKQDNHTVQVCVLNNPTDLKEELLLNGIFVHNLNLKHRWSFLEALYKLNNIISEFQPELVWSHLYFGILYSRLVSSNKKWIKHISVLHYHITSDNIRKNLWTSFRNWIFDITHRFDFETVAVSSSVKKDYEQFFSWKNIKVIYNAIDFATLDNSIENYNKYDTRRKYGMSDSDYIIVLPGRLHSSKGHRYLLKAFHIIKERSILPLKLIFAGNGSLKAELEQYIYEHKLFNEVILTGNLPQNELFRVIKSSDLVVLPSLFEAFGMALVEAMYLEKPTISTSIDGLKEISENNVNTIQVPIQNSDAIVESILKLIHDDSLSQKIAENAHISANKYNINNIIKQWYKLFNGELI